VRFQVRPRAEEPEPLRTDVAGAVVRLSRGPLWQQGPDQRIDPTRVSSPRELDQVFGGEQPGTCSRAALKGFFDNGGKTLWVVRVAGQANTGTCTVSVARAQGLLASTDSKGVITRADTLRFTATSPGAWADGLAVVVRLHTGGTPGGEPLAQLWVTRADEPVEILDGLEPEQLLEQINARSLLVRCSVEVAAAAPTGPPPREGLFPPSPEPLLGASEDPNPSALDYQRAAEALCDLDEPALLFAPDARADLGTWAKDFYAAWASRAALSLDRLVLSDPAPDSSGEALAKQLADLRAACGASEAGPRSMAAAALYYPWVKVLDGDEVRALPPSGHLAGFIARLDRERGAHHTPANDILLGAIDLDREYDPAERTLLHDKGLNALRCTRGRGVEVWGSRTVDPIPERRWLAHRRLIHRLVRAFRRQGEALIFTSNTPLLRLTLVRALTAVLLEAFRAGALKGAVPAEGFSVKCDDDTNPPDAYDRGQCIAVAKFAPAVPMEFIELSVALTKDGTLEVLG
jgi:hypothetical protein